MTFNQIKEVALIHFAENGYEGTSMAQIADDVGIKKQSIYTHFKGKDELFLQVCREVFSNELRMVEQFIDHHNPQQIDKFLLNFLVQYSERYEENDFTKFWLRTSFFPPAHLYDVVMKYVYEYLDKVEELLLPIIQKAVTEGKVSSSVSADAATVAFLGVLDGIFVEMLYGGSQRLKKRLDASWQLYWRGLSKD
ncbi:TetR/AcrR family transcriptional regulator [Bacillus dakarensis]|uniref:TetR/AcrR family transcriptional regulator n=1 Tax=Robertmurraya dakarensis TaxID=1926278 RepID=UPI0009813FDA|nr:TetR/AcrR family transcriptional regulator [Bacillus dakarensis]